jgi:GT2 family glycosyltransferase
MAAPAEVAVLIPSWNSRDLLPRCLDSLAGQEAALEVFVVDNGSSDGTVALLEERGVPHLALGENTGFAAAVNSAVARTTAPALLPLNADAALEPGAVMAMLAALGEDPERGGIAPRILQAEEGVDTQTARLYSRGQALTADGRAYELGAGEPPGQAAERPREVFGVCGAVCLLRREMFQMLGGYDESYFSFYEDVDLNVRARILGRRFDYAPDAVAWHLGNASWQATAARPGAWNARFVARNRIATQAKFMPASALPRIAAVEVGALARAAGQGRFQATATGKTEGLRRLRRSLGERRRLAAAGDLLRARRWLGRP